jgi:hypothetical protein
MKEQEMKSIKTDSKGSTKVKRRHSDSPTENQDVSGSSGQGKKRAKKVSDTSIEEGKIDDSGEIDDSDDACVVCGSEFAPKKNLLVYCETEGVSS